MSGRGNKSTLRFHQRMLFHLSPSPCAVNVPRTPQSREFFEVFEGTSGPSVRAFVVGKRLIHLCGRHFLQGCKA